MNYPPVRRKPKILYRALALAALAMFVTTFVLALAGYEPAIEQLAAFFFCFVLSMFLLAKDKQMAWLEWLRQIDAMQLESARTAMEGYVRLIGENGDVLMQSTFENLYAMAVLRDGRARRTFASGFIFDVTAPTVLNTTDERLSALAEDPYPPADTHPEPRACEG